MKDWRLESLCVRDSFARGKKLLQAKEGNRCRLWHKSSPGSAMFCSLRFR